MVGLGRGHDRLALAREVIDEQAAALGVELGGDVVEQHQRHRAVVVDQHPPLGEQQRQQRGSLLALRAVTANRLAVALECELVEVGAVTGVAAGEIAVATLGDLARQRRRLARLASRLVGEVPVPSPSDSAAEANGSRDPRDRLAAQRDQLDPGGAELGLPSVQSRLAGGAGANASQERVSLRQGARIAAADLVAGRPQGGAEAIEMGATPRRAGP